MRIEIGTELPNKHNLTNQGNPITFNVKKVWEPEAPDASSALSNVIVDLYYIVNGQSNVFKNNIILTAPDYEYTWTNLPSIDENGKPIDNTGKEDTLYNTTDNVTINQLIVYIREYKEGVESLSTDVINAFTNYVENDIVNPLTKERFSDNMVIIISNTSTGFTFKVCTSDVVCETVDML